MHSRISRGAGARMQTSKPTSTYEPEREFGMLDRARMFWIQQSTWQHLAPDSGISSSQGTGLVAVKFCTTILCEASLAMRTPPGRICAGQCKLPVWHPVPFASSANQVLLTNTSD